MALALETNPDSASTGEMVDSQILVSNLSEAVSGALTLRVLWPEELASTPTVTHGGGCDGNCSPGEYLVWDLGMLGPTRKKILTMTG